MRARHLAVLLLLWAVVAGCITVYDDSTTELENPVFNTSVTLSGSLDIAHLFSVGGKPTPTPPKQP